jgi:hypothetical protein
MCRREESYFNLKEDAHMKIKYQYVFPICINQFNYLRQFYSYFIFFDILIPFISLTIE